MSNRFTRVLVFSLVLTALTIAGGFVYAKALTYTFLTGDTQTKKNSEIFYYALKQDTIDILFCGSSGLWAGISPMTVWEEIGVTSYNRCANVQYPITLYHFLLASLETQTPKLVVLDGQPLTMSFNIEDANGTRAMFDTYEIMRPSSAKDSFFAAVADCSKSSITRKLGVKFPFLLLYPYNSVRRAFEISSKTENTSYSEHAYAMGGIFSSYSAEANFGDNWMKFTGETRQIEDINLDYYIKTIETCLDNNIQVVIISAPYSGWSYSRHNSVQEICDRYGLIYLDYNEKQMFDKVGLNLLTDYYDNGGHLNGRGNSKFSKVLADDLQRLFHLEPESDPETLSFWNDLYAEFKVNYSQYSEAAEKTNN